MGHSGRGFEGRARTCIMKERSRLQNCASEARRRERVPGRCFIGPISEQGRRRASSLEPALPEAHTPATANRCVAHRLVSNRSETNFSLRQPKLLFIHDVNDLITISSDELLHVY